MLNTPLYNMSINICAPIFRGQGKKQKNNFVRFLVQMRTRKFASEDY